jgi:hypothetical protein
LGGVQTGSLRAFRGQRRAYDRRSLDRDVIAYGAQNLPAQITTQQTIDATGPAAHHVAGEALNSWTAGWLAGHSGQVRQRFRVRLYRVYLRRVR